MFFKAARKGRNDWYLYIFTLLFCLGGNLIGSIPLIGYLTHQGVSMFALSDDMAAAFASIENKNMLLLLIALPFVATLLIFWLCLRLLHKKKLRHVATGYSTIRWNRFFWSFGLVSILMVIGTMVSYFLNPEAFQWQFDPQKFLILLGVSLIFITIQSATEELLFRGYFTQGIGLLFNSRLLALLLPALAFGSLHLSNPEVAEHGIATMFPMYVLMGLVFGVMTLMDEGTELAMGAHAANNICISLLVTTPEAVLQTDSLLKTMEPANINEQYISLFLMEGIVLIVMAWKYNWSGWEQKLLGSIKEAA